MIYFTLILQILKILKRHSNLNKVKNIFAINFEIIIILLRNEKRQNQLITSDFIDAYLRNHCSWKNNLKMKKKHSHTHTHNFAAGFVRQQKQQIFN